MFYELSKIGSVLLVSLICITELYLSVVAAEAVFAKYSIFPFSSTIFGTDEEDKNDRLEFAKLVLLNGVTYAAYNQMSFLVLSLTTVLSHSVGNSFRRIATIIFSVYMFGNTITTQNAIGMVLAIAGVVLYSFSKARDEAEAKTGKYAV
jgi:drug/metabolite transporter (DMT)-like permease